MPSTDPSKADYNKEEENDPQPKCEGPQRQIAPDALVKLQELNAFQRQLRLLRDTKELPTTVQKKLLQIVLRNGCLLRAPSCGPLTTASEKNDYNGHQPRYGRPSP